MVTLRHLQRLLGAAALVGLLGCSSRNAAPDPPNLAVPPRVDAVAPPGTYLPVEKATADELVRVVKHDVAKPDANAPPKKKINVMAIGGGGQYGAYAAGLLLGWTARGDRPQFDVMTGISSGALIATLAYMGPKYDPIIQDVFTNLETKDLFKYRSIPVHIVQLGAVASSDPLRQMLERYIGDEFIADMAAANCAGRKLYVGTHNLHTRRLVIWDLGAIAASGRPNARCEVINILVATASIAGLAPPVPIQVTLDGATHTEMHADGGGLAQAFVRFGPEVPKPDPNGKPGEWLAGSNFYSIAGGKLYADPHVGPVKFISSIIGNISGSLYALYRADLWRLYALCQSSGMKFHHAFIPQDFETAKNSTEFDPVEQKKLFAIGYELMVKNQMWRTTPPGYEPAEFELPRAGFNFSSGPPATLP